ncbi:MAG: aspartyl protease family protein [Gemmatimonadaceae bacterium]
MLKPFRTASLLAVLACAPSQARPQQTFPFEFEDARLFVPVKLADSATRWMILDTGASPTILDANVAAALGLTVTPAGSTTGAGTNSLRVGRARSVSLRVGGVPLGPTDVSVSEIDSLLAPSQGRHAPGIIGSRFFLEHVVEIDFARSVVEVHDPATYRYDGRGIALPMTLNNGVPLIAGRMTAPDGTVIPMRLLVDLGAKSTLLVSEHFIAEQALMPRFPNRVVSPLGAGVGGTTRYAFTRLPELALGSGGDALVTDSIVAGLSVGGTLRTDWYDGLLGADFLQRYRVIFDYSRKRVILEPRTPVVPPAAYDMSGMFLLASGSDLRTFVVRELVQGGPAEAAGIAVGDTLVALDGQPATAVTLGSLRQRLKAGDGREVRIEVARGGGRSVHVVRLRRLL